MAPPCCAPSAPPFMAPLPFLKCTFRYFTVLYSPYLLLSSSPSSRCTPALCLTCNLPWLSAALQHTDPLHTDNCTVTRPLFLGFRSMAVWLLPRPSSAPQCSTAAQLPPRPSVLCQPVSTGDTSREMYCFDALQLNPQLLCSFYNTLLAWICKHVMYRR